ncbi:5'-3' exonuclease [Stackebrandtia nassauensis]|uniref:5'-3' exonuclease n=1 Tax=Stackebrandtia nassauensis (strain DSM 44728 / CIP 108903 / NRRL B-16338 / NBRC 102104 / LLR-40K-21) TaxID=446470 RepID=D3QBG2_STANL|nr:5'-3' exonuclease H3TH domain-containing protein [Stackebrandtia nassauensis]ADD42844.1 5'-3' exonuclease [Stackebrandtia nassauensis DSM 44728]
MLVLVDAPGLWYRSFYGLPSSLRGPDGTQINAVRGFIDGLATLIRNHNATGLACAVDNDWRPAWRVDLLPSYKTHRLADNGGEEEPDALPHQVAIITQLLTAWGIPVIGVDGYEADDVLATLATTTKGPVGVATGDRDLFQLIDDDNDIRVIYFGRGIAKAETLDDAALVARHGVHPDQYVDFAVLRGDPSDGLPGVKGIGDKTAATLITTHGNLTDARAAAADPATTMAPRVRKALTESGEYLDAAVKVVRTANDAPVPDIDPSLRPEPADPQAVETLSDTYGLANSLNRLREALTAATGNS